jgi:hypothetical protein
MLRQSKPNWISFSIKFKESHRSNQPKELSKGVVKSRRKTSSLVRFDHLCLRNEFLEMVNDAWTMTGGHEYLTGCMWRKALTSKLCATDIGRRSCRQATCPLWKEFGLDGFLGVEPTRVRIALADRLRLGGGGGGNHIGCRPTCLGKACRATFELYPGICLKIQEKQENLTQGSRVAKTSRCADLAVFRGTVSAGLLSICSPRLPVGDFSPPSVGTCVF